MSLKKRSQSRPAQASKLHALYNRPGFMMRRSLQIATSIFDEEAGALVTTTAQYGALWVLSCTSDVDQIGLAKLMGLDRSTAGLVVSNLEKEGLILRRSDTIDRRRKVLELTDKGRDMLAKLAGPAERVQRRLLSAFTPAEAKAFMRLLSKFVWTFNDQIRTPIAFEPPNAGQGGQGTKKRKR